MGRGMRAAAALLVGLLSVPASASETITYTYDALGRLLTVVHSGTVNNGVAANYSYDKANNRTIVTVTGAPVPQSLFIVVPLNGYTLIKVR